MDSISRVTTRDKEYLFCVGKWRSHWGIKMKIRKNFVVLSGINEELWSSENFGWKDEHEESPKEILHSAEGYGNHTMWHNSHNSLQMMRIGRRFASKSKKMRTFVKFYIIGANWTRETRISSCFQLFRQHSVTILWR
jgi:hypothetical protein